MEEIDKKDPKAIHLNSPFVSVTQDSSSVTAHFENGTTASGQVLIGCDGIRSAVRQDLYGIDDPEFLNYVAWRGLVPIESLPDGLVTPDTGVLRGQNKSFTRYKIREGTLVNYVAFARRDDWTEDGWMVPSTVDEVMEEFSDATDEVSLIVTNTPPDTCFKWGLLGRDPLPRWTKRPFRKGLSGRCRCDSRKVAETDLEPPCGRRPPESSIAARRCVIRLI